MTISPHARSNAYQAISPLKRPTPLQSGTLEQFKPVFQQPMATGARQKIVDISNVFGSIGTGASDLTSSSDTSTAAVAVATPVTPSTTAPKVIDTPGSTVSAGIMVGGMVSAGPLSAGLAGITATSVSQLPQPTGTRLIAVADDAAKFNYDPIAMIKDRLTKLGVNPASVKLETWTDNVNGPGGQRVNLYVRGTFPNGTTENYAVERVLQNPDITAVEIQSQLSHA